MDGLPKLTATSRSRLSDVLTSKAAAAENGASLSDAITLLAGDVSNADILRSLTAASTRDVRLVREALTEFTEVLRSLPPESTDHLHLESFGHCLSQIESQHLKITTVTTVNPLSKVMVAGMQTWGEDIATRVPDSATAEEHGMINAVHSGGGATHTLHLTDREDAIVKFESHGIPPEREYYFNLLAKRLGLPSSEIAIIHPEHESAGKVTALFNEDAYSPVTSLIMSHIPGHALEESMPEEFDTIFRRKDGRLSSNGSTQMTLCGKMLAMSWFMGDYDHFPSGTDPSNALEGNRPGNPGNIMVCDKSLVFIDFAASYPTSGIQKDGSMQWGTLNSDLPKLLDGSHDNELLKQAFAACRAADPVFSEACEIALTKLPLSDMTLASSMGKLLPEPVTEEANDAEEEAADMRTTSFQKNIAAVYDVASVAEKAATAMGSISESPESPYLTSGISFLVDQFGLELKELPPELIIQMGDAMRAGFLETAATLNAMPIDEFGSIADTHLRPLADAEGHFSRPDERREPLAQVLQLDMIALMKPLWERITH